MAPKNRSRPSNQTPLHWIYCNSIVKKISFELVALINRTQQQLYKWDMQGVQHSYRLRLRDATTAAGALDPP